jgi:two-component system sensor histidine kinase HydH
MAANKKQDNEQRISDAAQTAVNLSHGVKNILQAVKGSMEVVRHSLEIGDTGRAKRGVKILQRNLEKIEKLVLDMLRYSSDSEPEFQSCDFNGLVSSTVEALRARAEEQGKKIEVICGEGPETVWCDGERIYDVVLNLVLNAVEAVAADSGVVKVAVEYDGDGEQVLLRVSDNGPGIEDVESIFEPFHTAKAKVGIGLGLAITKKIVAQHNGQIHVQSQPSEGATFTVRLPVK